MWAMEFAAKTFEYMAIAFVTTVGIVCAILVVLFIVDRTQRRDAVRRNYPVIGRFRYLFTTLGEFFRQYFFAMDREELPFNRAQRDWVERAASGHGNTIAFGSTRNLSVPGTPIFVNAPFPPLEKDHAKTKPLLIGPTAAQPYEAPSFFNISGMSYGALSAPAVTALSLGAAEVGVWFNTGEGGVSPYHLKGGGDVVFQIGTAKYGVRNLDGTLSDEKLRAVAATPEVKMFELKLAQGAKPGKGGILPATKVSAEVAKIRGIKEGEASISPNRHPEISNAAELIDFLDHIRTVSGKPVGFKTVLGDFDAMEAFLDLVVERGMDHAPDFITLDGGDGGTGAAPMPLMDLVGLPLRESLPRLADMLNARGLKGRVRLIASGKLINPGDVAWALAAGADFVTAGRGFMFSLGCIQALKCNRNTCPTGITTHDKRLQKGLVPEVNSDKVANYARGIIKEVEIIAHSVGAKEPRQISRNHVRMVGQDGRTATLTELYPPVT